MAIRISILALAMAALAAAGPAPAQQPNGEPNGGPTHSVPEADARLADVAIRRSAVEAGFADDERICYTRFFVTNCIDKAKEKRRNALAGLRAIEIEASHFKRADAVDQRDRALAAQADKDAADAARRAALPAKPAPAPAPVRAGAAPTSRQAEHDAKLRQRQGRDAADAAKRAANAAAHERKQLDSAERQRKVAAKQAAKEEQARKDAAAAAKK